MDAIVAVIALVILLVNVMGFYIVWRGVQGMEQAVTAISRALQPEKRDGNGPL